MAYLPAQDQEQDQEGQQAQAQGQQQKAPVLGAPTAAAPQGSGGQSAQQTGAGEKATKQPSRSGSFTNLQSYVNANQGTDSKMGQAVGGVVNKEAKGASQGLEDWQKATADTINNNTVKMDEGFEDKLRNSPMAVNPEQYQQYATATYAGPQTAQEAEGFAETKGKFEKVGQLVGLSQGGLSDRGQLLDTAYSRPSYSQGERNLDSFILGTGEGGKQELANIDQNFGTFDTNFTQGAADIDAAIGTAKQTTKDTRDQAIGAATDSYDSLKQEYQSASQQAQEYNDYQTQQYNALQNLTNYFKDPHFRGRAIDEFSARSGLSPMQVSSWFDSGKDPMQLVNRPEAVSAGNFLNPLFAKNWQAINSMLGKTVDPATLAATGQVTGRLDIDSEAATKNMQEYIAETNAPIAAFQKDQAQTQQYNAMQTNVNALAEFSGVDASNLQMISDELGNDIRQYTYRDPNTGEPKFNVALYRADLKKAEAAKEQRLAAEAAKSDAESRAQQEAEVSAWKSMTGNGGDSYDASSDYTNWTPQEWQRAAELAQKYGTAEQQQFYTSGARQNGVNI